MSSVHTASQSVHSSSPSHHTPTSAVLTTVTAAVSNGFSAYAASSPSGSSDIVHVVIHTTVKIPNFSRYYSASVSSFHPSYLALEDGSLLSSVYTSNLRTSEGWLIMGGALSVFFFQNTCTAIRYSRVVNVKNKSLFYMLIASQAIGFFISLSFLIADFSPGVDCTAMGMVKKTGVLMSTTFMITGILGTKAYRCLNNAGFVIVILAILRAAIIAVCGIVIVEYKGGRRFTGTCETLSESPLMPLSIILQFIETCFLCICFFWAVYISYRSPADHARLSLPLDDEDEASSVGTHEKVDEQHGGRRRRGWWDYVPSADVEKISQPPSSRCSTPKELVGRLRQWWSGEPVLPCNVFQRKPSLPGDLPIPQPRHVSAVSNGSSVHGSMNRENERPRAGSPPPPSVMERIIRYVPRADLLRNVLKNELLYTTFITAVLLVIAVIMMVGVTQQLLLGVNSWIMVDWIIISVCTMHSFGRVARRHEREAWLQDPANWRTMRHAAIEDQTALRPKNPHRAWSPVSVASNWRHRQRQRAESDRYSNVGPSRSTELSETYSPSFRIRSASFGRSPELPAPVSRSTSVVSSPVASLDSGFRPPVPWHGHGSPTILPSPEYPLSGSSTPQSDSHAILPRVVSANVPPTALRSTSAPVRTPERPSRRHAVPVWDPEILEPPDAEPR